MEKKKKLHIVYTAFAVMLALTSCDSENGEVNIPTEYSNKIYFRSYFPSIDQTRGEFISQENLTECRVTCINPDNIDFIDPKTGELKPYFNDISFEKDEYGRFKAHATVNCNWPSATDMLHFFAYYPPAESMKESTEDKNMFRLSNYSKKTDDNFVIDYRLENFQIASEIADQVDFITAYSKGNQQENGHEGIALNFTHQLARIELSAWGESDSYDIEIAGVRIGNPFTQGDFNFSALMPLSGQSNADHSGLWTNTTGHQKPIEHIFTTGESIILLSKRSESHASIDDAASIMGNGGAAMVIPMKEKIEAWEGKLDPNIDSDPYTTDKLYFSVLMRIRKVVEDEIAYPYPNNINNLPVEYFAVKKTGDVVSKRLYKKNNTYFIDEDFKIAYDLPSDEEVREFGWAAVPVSAKWEAGKIYTYKLNYSSGIGWQDPSYPQPGEPIISENVVVYVSVKDWEPGSDNDLMVPRK